MSDNKSPTSGGGGGANWCTIESDPGVFTSLIESFGVRNAELAELWSLDDDSLSRLVESHGRVYGLIFLFKWGGEEEGKTGDKNEEKKKKKKGEVLTGVDAPSGLFFARQVTTNACATQAILSVLLNSPEVTEGKEEGTKKDQKDMGGIILGSTLSSLKAFTSSFPPDLKGEAIGASDEIREAHNAFSRKDSFLTEEKKRMATADDDVFHFVAYLPHREEEASSSKEGFVYELDGLQPGPIRVGSFETKVDNDDDATNSDMTWLAVARSAIQSRIERYSASEIKFNLMAVVHDRRAVIQSKLSPLLSQEETDGAAAAAAVELRSDLEVEELKRSRWNVENERRRHNYLPFCVELIRGLAQSGKLDDLTKKAREREMENRKRNAGKAVMAK